MHPSATATSKLPLLTAFVACVVLSGGSLMAQQPRVGGVLTCTLGTISGSYGYSLTGIIPAAGAFTPSADYGNLVSDGNGSLTGSGITSTGGTIVSRTITGKYTMSANCTGTATLQESGGNTLHLSLTVVDNSGGIQLIQTDNGVVASGQAQRAPTGCSVSTVSGPYTYAVGGWLSASGNFVPFADAGRIVSDGKGNLTGKSTFSSTGTTGRRTFTGTYSIGSTCSGTVTLKDNLGNTNILAMTLVNNGQQILFIQSDSGTIVSGASQRGQSTCSAALLTGTYVYALEGFNSGGIFGATPVADSGQFTADGNGHLSGRSATSAGGTVISQTLSGSFTLNSDCTGSSVFTDNLGNTARLDFFIADGGNQVQFIETDAGTVLSGTAQKSGATCTAAALNGSYGYAIQGWQVSSGVAAFADSGQLAADGAGHFTGASTYSANGNIVKRTLTGTYQLNADCTGTGVLRDNLGASGNFRIIASGDGRRVSFIQTDPGTVISGVGQRQLAVPSDGIVSAASFSPSAVVPGSLVAIFGDSLATAVTTIATLPWPLQLGGVSVSVNGTGMPLYYVSPGQINAQLPLGIQPGSAQLVVTTNGVPSAPVTFTVPASGPGIFMYGLSRAIAVNPDGSVNGPGSPARPGDILVVYLTGAGPVQPNSGLTDGAASPPVLARVILPFNVTIGGLPATVDYLGLTPTTVGLYQLNVHVPAVPAGDNTLVLTVGGNASNSALIAIAP